MQTVWVFGNASSILQKFPAQPYVSGYLQFGGDAYGNATYDPLFGSLGDGGPST
jgi:L-ascorbate oxidase